MDEGTLLSFLGTSADREMETRVLELMMDKMPEDQFRDCLRTAFAELCADEKAEDLIRSAIDHMIYILYNDESEEEDDDYWPTLTGEIKDSFYFVRYMFIADLKDEGIAYCRTILDGLTVIAEESKNTLYNEFIVELRDEMRECIDSERYIEWFNH